MGKISKFDISLSTSNGIYHPGDVINGLVSLKLREDVYLHGIYVWVLGQSDVSWADRPGGRKTHFEYEIYMKDCIRLWGKDPEERRTKALILPAGGHEYRFQYKLPLQLPSTFESQDLCKGRVHYMLKARLESPDESVRMSHDKAFIVLSMLDLNKERRALEHIELSKDKYLCCCCCKSGPLTCWLRLDRTGYVPGEDINVDAEIQNLSRKEVTASFVTMQQIVYFHAQGITKSNITDIFRISGGKVKPGDTAMFHDIIHIPPLPPSRLDNCNIIDIEYVLTVGILPAGMTSVVELSAVILVGNVPHVDVVGTVSPSFSRYSHSSGEIEDYESEDFQRGKHQNVYIYYKNLYGCADGNQRRTDEATHMTNTVGNDSATNSNDVILHCNNIHS